MKIRNSGSCVGLGAGSVIAGKSVAVDVDVGVLVPVGVEEGVFVEVGNGVLV